MRQNLFLTGPIRSSMPEECRRGRRSDGLSPTSERSLFRGGGDELWGACCHSIINSAAKEKAFGMMDYEITNSNFRIFAHIRNFVVHHAKCLPPYKTLFPFPNGNRFPALGPAARQNVTALLFPHAGSKSVHLRATTLFRLICSFRHRVDPDNVILFTK